MVGSSYRSLAAIKAWGTVAKNSSADLQFLRSSTRNAARPARGRCEAVGCPPCGSSDETRLMTLFQERYCLPSGVSLAYLNSIHRLFCAACQILNKCNRRRLVFSALLSSCIGLVFWPFCRLGFVWGLSCPSSWVAVVEDRHWTSCAVFRDVLGIPSSSLWGLKGPRPPLLATLEKL